MKNPKRKKVPRMFARLAAVPFVLGIFFLLGCGSSLAASIDAEKIFKKQYACNAAETGSWKDSSWLQGEYYFLVRGCNDAHIYRCNATWPYNCERAE